MSKIEKTVAWAEQIAADDRHRVFTGTPEQSRL